MADLVKELARHAVNCYFETIPDEIINFAKMSLLDTLGTLIAGAPAVGCKTVVDRVLEWGGKEESSILMYKGKVPAHNAALANAVMARALDFCDCMDHGIHLSSSVIPAGLAVAEKVGGVKGSDFLAAIAVAEDISGRIDSATNNYHGFDPTLVGAVFASTVMAGRLMGLNEKEMANALGLALNESSGTFQSNIDGVLSVRFNQGLAAQAGIVCAEFALDGLTGVINVFDGVYGYFNLFSRGDQLPEHLVNELGKIFYIKNSIYKRFPSCGATLCATDSAVALVAEQNFEPADIERVKVRVGRFVYNLVGGRFKIGDNPVVDAQFSLQYTVANALSRKYPRLEHFTESYIKDEVLLDLVNRVEVIVDDNDPKLNEYPMHLSAEVTVILKNGKQFNRLTHYFKGHPLNTMSMDDIVQKFRNNVIDFAREWFDSSSADELIKIVSSAQNYPDITAIVPILKAIK